MRTTRTLLAAMAAGLMTLSAIPASAAPQQRHDNAPQQQQQQQPQRGQANNNGGGNSQYGNWNTSWGARPAAPPRSFTRHSDWYRHVRACGQRYKSYNAATDRYTVRRGQTAICRL
jgi:hypothetical protein